MIYLKKSVDGHVSLQKGKKDMVSLKDFSVDREFTNQN